jgi:hypothetical protein
MAQVRQMTPSSKVVAPLPPVMPRLSEADIELVAVVVAVIDDQPMVRIVPDGGGKLPSARYRLGAGQSLDGSLRAGVLRETGLALGFVEQLQCVALTPSLRTQANTISPPQTAGAVGMPSFRGRTGGAAGRRFCAS